MTFFGWILVVFLALMAVTALGSQRDTDKPNTNALALVILVALIAGTLTVGTGTGL